MGKAIVVASGKGGTGKTTAAAAISSYLAVSGHRTLCIDGDAGLKNLDLSLGMSDRTILDFGDVIAGRCGLDEAVAVHPDIGGLFFLTAPLEPVLNENEAAGLIKLVNFAKTVFDFCIIDSPAGLGPGFRAAAGGADSALIVSAFDPSSCRDSGRVVMELKEMGISDIRLIINRVRRSLLSRARATIDDAVDSIGAQLIGIVPEDKNVILASAAATPLVLYASGGASAAFSRIAGRLAGKKVPLRLH